MQQCVKLAMAIETNKTLIFLLRLGEDNKKQKRARNFNGLMLFQC